MSDIRFEILQRSRVAGYSSTSHVRGQVLRGSLPEPTLGSDPKLPGFSDVLESSGEVRGSPAAGDWARCMAEQSPSVGPSDNTNTLSGIESHRLALDVYRDGP